MSSITWIVVAVLALPVGMFLFGFIQGLTEEIYKSFSKTPIPQPIQSELMTRLDRFAPYNRISGYFPSDN
jgi:hypothetical protein